MGLTRTDGYAILNIQTQTKPILSIGSTNHLVHDSSCAQIPEFSQLNTNCLF